MPNEVEEILKKIHVMFARCEALEGTPDSVIVSKQEMFALFKELNEAVYAVLDRYEATTRSREQARLEFEREAAGIIAKAKKDADDVQAATLLYTDSMVGKVKELIEKAQQDVKNNMIELMAQIDQEQETLMANRDSVKEELAMYRDGSEYLKLLEKLREEQNKKAKNEVDEDEQPEEEPQKPGFVVKVNKPGENTGVTYSKRKHGRSGQRKPEASGGAESAEAADPNEVPTPKGTVFTAEDFNLDAEYEQWKDEQGRSEGDTTQTKKGVFAGLFGKKKKA